MLRILSLVQVMSIKDLKRSMENGRKKSQISQNHQEMHSQLGKETKFKRRRRSQTIETSAKHPGQNCSELRK